VTKVALDRDAAQANKESWSRNSEKQTATTTADLSGVDIACKLGNKIKCFYSETIFAN
jgi:hypothetical protein